MPPAECALIRVVAFHATHRYGLARWSREENQAVFGALTETHPHAFRVEVEVSGTPDPETGFLLDLVALDRLLEEEIHLPLHGSHLNDAIEAFSEGTLQPSTEALASWIGDRLLSKIPSPARLRAVRVWESESLAGVARYGAS
jgi:6-pyruvoyltetrahydropterin/6-carboxytetrahydropterin synthase